MAKNLIIIGAGGDGRNVADIVAEMNREWNLLGFLDDDPEKQGTKINGIPVLGGTTDIDKYSSCRFIVLCGAHKDRFIKKSTIAKLPIPAENYATVIHPTAWISRHAIIGR